MLSHFNTSVSAQKEQKLILASEKMGGKSELQFQKTYMEHVECKQTKHLKVYERFGFIQNIISVLHNGHNIH